jgi:hypothetical protein
MSAVSCGISTALVSSRISREAAGLLRWVYQATQNPDELTRQLKEKAALKRATWPTEPKITLRFIRSFDRDCFAFLEETSGGRTPPFGPL